MTHCSFSCLTKGESIMAVYSTQALRHPTCWTHAPCAPRAQPPSPPSPSRLYVPFQSRHDSSQLLLLEMTLRSFSCLTAGESIMVAYNNKRYFIDVVDARPGAAISIIETNCEVDFAPPLDYVEPARAPAAPSQGAAAAPGGGAGGSEGGGKKSAAKDGKAGVPPSPHTLPPSFSPPPLPHFCPLPHSPACFSYLTPTRHTSHTQGAALHNSPPSPPPPSPPPPHTLQPSLTSVLSLTPAFFSDLNQMQPPHPRSPPSCLSFPPPFFLLPLSTLPHLLSHLTPTTRSDPTPGVQLHTIHVSPSLPAFAPLPHSPAYAAPPPEEPTFTPFVGIGRRLDGRPAASPSSPATSAAATSAASREGVSGAGGAGGARGSAGGTGSSSAAGAAAASGGRKEGRLVFGSGDGAPRAGPRVRG
ncbi:unnamed protein product [Closterium sp. Naga37s-1]|nr:unnamed protein product [Closterium sp. Naga37s-1]